jgi:OHCU decarboxylase
MDAASVSVTALAPIDDLNRLPRHEFVAALRPLFEAAGPLGDALYDARPFESYPALLERASEIVETLPREQQIEVVNAHPRIGESAAVVRQTSEQSYREQGYEAEAGRDMRAVYERLERLNQQYEVRFGFRFVVFVNGRGKADIADVLERRLAGTPEDELRTARHDMIEIARDRLARLG